MGPTSVIWHRSGATTPHPPPPLSVLFTDEWPARGALCEFAERRLIGVEGSGFLLTSRPLLAKWKGRDRAKPEFSRGSRDVSGVSRDSNGERRSASLRSAAATLLLESLVSICSSRPLLAKWKGRDRAKPEFSRGSRDASGVSRDSNRGKTVGLVSLGRCDLRIRIPRFHLLVASAPRKMEGAGFEPRGALRGKLPGRFLAFWPAALYH